MTDPMSQPCKRSAEQYLLPAIILLTLAVFSPVLGNGFINYDDPAFVTYNPMVQNGVTWEGIRQAFLAAHESNWIPLTWISHMLDVQLFGFNPVGHHFVNLLFHAASTALLFLFLRQVTAAPWRSAMVALLFALHPLHVESVAWIAERKDVLCAFFWMATLLAYARYAARPVVGRYLLVLLLFTLGLLSKPMIVTLPLVLLLLDWWPLGRRGTTPPRATIPRLLAEKVPFFILTACSSYITYYAQHEAGSVYQGYTVAARAGRAAIVYVAYLGKMIWPSKLAVIYPFDKYPPTDLKIMAAALFLLTLTVAAAWLYRRLPWLLIGWGWYLISLVPVIGFIQIGQHAMADRYTYIPLIGIFIACVWGLSELLAPWHRRATALPLLSAGVVVAMAIITLMQLQHWKNDTTLFSHALQVTQNNWVAYNNLGMAIMDAGKTEESLAYFTASVQAKPSFVPAYLNLGYAHHALGQVDASLAAYRNALQFEPDNPKAHLALGLLYLEQGKTDTAWTKYLTLRSLESPYAEKLLREIRGGTDSPVAPPPPPPRAERGAPRAP